MQLSILSLQRNQSASDRCNGSASFVEVFVFGSNVAEVHWTSATGKHLLQCQTIRGSNVVKVHRTDATTNK